MKDDMLEFMSNVIRSRHNVKIAAFQKHCLSWSIALVVPLCEQPYASSDSLHDNCNGLADFYAS
jgi:hypothetical protein